MACLTTVSVFVLAGWAAAAAPDEDESSASTTASAESPVSFSPASLFAGSSIALAPDSFVAVFAGCAFAPPKDASGSFAPSAPE